ncbi:MAG: S-methyl-5-thioribose-1-phosphate isomerase [Dethiobacteria bacterium]
MEHIAWREEKLYLLDQRLLPHEIAFKVCDSYHDVVKAIKDMHVRGAPAIGISAAFGMTLAAGEALAKRLSSEKTRELLKTAAVDLANSRPTAVNLKWAIDKADQWLSKYDNASTVEIYKGLEQLALTIFNDDIINNRQIGFNGSKLVPQKAVILTHCNAGALATGGFGTALGVIRAAVEEGKIVSVLVDETRPLLQGARITAFELLNEGIPATLITDNSAGYLMSTGKVDLIVVGADRIAANGDTANKIGTYSLAVLANYHNIPFYVAAPLSTVDLMIDSGHEIIIEERKEIEVTSLYGKSIAPEGIKALNYAFDVTPAELITAIITEKGVIKKPDRNKIAAQFREGGFSFEEHID